jgi:hypothetical protein
MRLLKMDPGFHGSCGCREPFEIVCGHVVRSVFDGAPTTVYVYGAARATTRSGDQSIIEVAEVCDPAERERIRHEIAERKKVGVRDVVWAKL